MLKKINEAYEISVEIHLVVIGSRRDDSPHEDNQLFLTMEDSIPKVEVPSGPIELDWENAWNVEPEFIWAPLTEEGFTFWPYEPRVEWSLEEEQISELWESRKEDEEFRYFFGRALINPEVSYEWDFDDNSLDDLYLSVIEQPIYRSLRLGSKNLKMARYVLIPSNLG